MSDLLTLIYSLEKESQRWILGNDTNNALEEGFDHKRVVHPGTGGTPVFMPDEQQKLWQELMNTEGDGTPRSAYIHVPFCERKCSYCHFFQNASQEEVLHKYVDNVIRELKVASTYKRLQTGVINTVYFGGGTPSTLCAEDISRLGKAVYDYLPLAPDCEVTLESRIHDMDDARIEAALKAGVNRFSLGVQSFDTKVRQAVGRIDDEKTVIDALQRLVKTNSAAIAIDLMFGLPYQTMENWRRDLEIQFDLGLHGGDFYQLNLFPGSDLDKAVKRGSIEACMTTKEQARLYAYTLEVLKREYPHITMIDASHWAASRRERNLYNTLTKFGYDMFSFGSCAGGQLGNVGMMHLRDLPDYTAAVEAGQKPLMIMSIGHDSHRFIGDVKYQLDMSYMDGAFFKRKWGVDVVGALKPLFKVWEEKGFITMEGEVVRFTVAGMFWHDNLIQAVLESIDMLQVKDSVKLRVDRVAEQDR